MMIWGDNIIHITEKRRLRMYHFTLVSMIEFDYNSNHIFDFSKPLHRLASDFFNIPSKDLYQILFK